MKQPVGESAQSAQGSNKRPRYLDAPAESNQTTQAPAGPRDTIAPRITSLPPQSENIPPQDAYPHLSWFAYIPPDLLPPRDRALAKSRASVPALKGMPAPALPLTDRPTPKRETPRPESSGLPVLPAPRAFEFFSMQIEEKRADSKPERGGKRAEAIKRADKFRGTWRNPLQARAWLEKLTSPSDRKLPPHANASTGVHWMLATGGHWVPCDVLRLIISHMSPRSAVNWALTCTYHYGMVDTQRPLSRLPTFLAFLPTTRAAPGQDLLEWVLDWFNPAESALSDALYTPLDQRLRRVMNLAVRGAIPNDTWPSTIALADKAVRSLGEHALTAFNDLLDEYVEQHQSVDINLEKQRLALSRIVPTLARQLKKTEQTDHQLVDQTWLKLARLLPLISHTGWTLFPEGEPVDLNDAALLHLRLLELAESEAWPARSVEEKLRCARNCLADYLDYAGLATQLVAQVEAAPRTPARRYTLEKRLEATRHIAGLCAVLGLDHACEQVLAPQSLALLEAEADILASGLLSPWAADDRRVISTLSGPLAPQEAKFSLAASMAWRLGRFMNMALDLHAPQPGLLARLQTIANKWPADQRGDAVREWCKGVVQTQAAVMKRSGGGRKP